ncbi:MAG: energy-coupling factor transporter transmembrane protein EcfT [Halobacteriales archaeon]
MLTYAPGETVAHGLDPRSKLLLQAAFAVAAFAHTTPLRLAALTVLALALLATAGLHPLEVVSAYRYALPILAVAPLVAGATLGPPWVRADAVVAASLGSYRLLLVLAVSGVYVHTTSARASRAAIQRTVPGRAGQFLGLGVGFVFRFLPTLRADLRRVREASAARLGTERPRHERMARIAVVGLDRALARADTLALALRARCLAWNPTLPPLSFRPRDYAVSAASVALAAGALVV